jgi:hypothetical protein
MPWRLKGGAGGGHRVNLVFNTASVTPTANLVLNAASRAVGTLVLKAV